MGLPVKIKYSLIKSRGGTELDDFLSNKPLTEPGYQSEREYYTEDFICALAAVYNFDAADIYLLTDLYEIAYRYRLGNRLAAGDKERMPEYRKNLSKLQRKYRAFMDELEAQGGDYFNLEVSGGARIAEALDLGVDPDLDPQDYAGMQFSKSYCYWYEFERYTTFFGLGLDHNIEQLKSRGGRPKNQGLHLSIGYIGRFWERRLGRKYTVDHHGGQGLTEAFEFTKRLLTPLDDIDDVQIITAMRTEIKLLRKYETDGTFHNNLDQKTD